MKVLLITGATGSIGRVLAKQAMLEGWQVIVHGSTEATVNSLVEALHQHHPATQVRGLWENVTHPGAVKNLVNNAATQFGTIDAIADCLVTGPKQGGVTGPFEATNPASYLAFAEYSIVYLEQLTHAAMPFLKASQGAMVTLVSDAGLFPAPRQAIIGAARAAAISFIKNLSLEVARDGVRANCISLSYVENTRSFDKLAKAGFDRAENARKKAGLGLPTPQDIVPAVLFLCSQQAQKITGQVLSINGGLNS